MAPETLYNGIELPAVWPPRSMDENSLEPAPVPYLENGPAAIDIDLDNSRDELRAAVLECDNTPVAGLGAAAGRPLAADSTCAALTWSSGSDLAQLAGRPLKLRFQLQKGRLFSFWITDGPGGASYGYGAAGGPGFTAERELPDCQV